MNERSRKDVYITEDCLYNNVYLNALQSETTDTDRNWCIKSSSVKSIFTVKEECFRSDTLTLSCILILKDDICRMQLWCQRCRNASYSNDF